MNTENTYIAIAQTFRRPRVKRQESVFYCVSIFIGETSVKRKYKCNRQQSQLEPTSYNGSVLLNES